MLEIEFGMIGIDEEGVTFETNGDCVMVVDDTLQFTTFRVQGISAEVIKELSDLGDDAVYILDKPSAMLFVKKDDAVINLIELKDKHVTILDNMISPTISASYRLWIKEGVRPPDDNSMVFKVLNGEEIPTSRGVNSDTLLISNISEYIQKHKKDYDLFNDGLYFEYITGVNYLIMFRAPSESNDEREVLSILDLNKDDKIKITFVIKDLD